MNHGIWMVNSVDNFLVGNISNSNKFDGIVADNNSGARIENNTLSRNAGEALVIQTNAAVDLGGGSMGSLGGNILSCSGTTDLWVNTAGTIQAQNNKWDHVPPTTSSNVPPSTCNAGSDICLNLTGISVVTNGATQAIGFCQ